MKLSIYGSVILNRKPTSFEEKRETFIYTHVVTSSIILSRHRKSLSQLGAGWLGRSLNNFVRKVAFHEYTS